MAFRCSKLKIIIFQGMSEERRIIMRNLFSILCLIHWRQCPVSALLVESAIPISGKGSIDMDGLENVISVLDYILDTKRKDILWEAFC